MLVIPRVNSDVMREVVDAAERVLAERHAVMGCGGDVAYCLTCRSEGQRLLDLLAAVDEHLADLEFAAEAESWPDLPECESCGNWICGSAYCEACAGE